MLTYALFSSLFSALVSFRYILCFFVFLFFIYLSNKYCLLKLVLLNFCLQKTSFLLQTHFFGWLERHAMYLDPKVKTFHDSMFLATPLRNCLFFMKYCRKEKFHSVFLLLILRHLKFTAMWMGKHGIICSLIGTKTDLSNLGNETRERTQDSQYTEFISYVCYRIPIKSIVPVLQLLESGKGRRFWNGNWSSPDGMWPASVLCKIEQISPPPPFITVFR